MIQTKTFPESHGIIGNSRAMPPVKRVSRFDTMRKGENHGFRLFVDISFHLEQRMDTAECFPGREGMLPKVVGSRFKSLQSKGSIVSSRNQYYWRQAVAGIGLYPPAYFQRIGIRQQ